MLFDSYYFLLVVPAMILALWAQARVKSTFNRYSQQHTHNGITGAEAARAVLRASDISDVRIEHIRGNLNDHYDPHDQVIRLSDAVYQADTVAAVCVAAHEAGHAVQYAKGYAPIKLRAAIIPATRFGSMLAMPLLIAGLIFSIESLFIMGIVFFGVSVVFQLITLPVEYNASDRALAALSEGNILYEDVCPAHKKHFLRPR